MLLVLTSYSIQVMCSEYEDEEGEKEKLTRDQIPLTKQHEKGDDVNGSDFFV